MKNVSAYLCNVILVVVLSVLVFMPFGCSSLSQPGETVAEGHRRQQRTLRINQQEMISDIDTVLMLDRPSRLSDLRVP
jgi:ABC-type Fe3+ transport system permease subunit